MNFNKEHHTIKINNDSKKILKFINLISNILELNFKANINKNHPFIKTVHKCAIKAFDSPGDEFIKKYMSIMHISSLKKVRNITDPSLLYLFLKQYYSEFENNNIELLKHFDSEELFKIWYNFNQHKLNFNFIEHNIDRTSSCSNTLKQMLKNLFKGKINKYDSNRLELNKELYTNQFVSYDTLIFIEVNDLLVVKINDKLINLIMYFDKSESKKDILVTIQNVLRIIYFYNNLNIEFGEGPVNNFNLKIIVSTNKKCFSQDPTIVRAVTPENINSGSSIRNEVVTVWRKEELEKVLMHELQHFMDFDFYVFHKKYKKAENYILSVFHVDGTDKTNESFNESLAGLINIIYQSVKYDKPIEKIYHYELTYLLLQISKFLLYFNNDKFINCKCIFKNHPNHIIFKQTTSALSYHVIKSFIFFNINSFLDFITDINIKCNTNDKVLQYKDFLEEMFNSDHNFMFKIVDKITKLIQDKKIKNNNKIALNSLRMSLLSN